MFRRLRHFGEGSLSVFGFHAITAEPLPVEDFCFIRKRSLHPQGDHWGVTLNSLAICFWRPGKRCIRVVEGRDGWTGGHRWDAATADESPGESRQPNYTSK